MASSIEKYSRSEQKFIVLIQSYFSQRIVLNTVLAQSHFYALRKTIRWVHVLLPQQPRLSLEPHHQQSKSSNCAANTAHLPRLRFTPQ